MTASNVSFSTVEFIPQGKGEDTESFKKPENGQNGKKKPARPRNQSLFRNPPLNEGGWPVSEEKDTPLKSVKNFLSNLGLINEYN